MSIDQPSSLQRTELAPTPLRPSDEDASASASGGLGTAPSSRAGGATAPKVAAFDAERMRAAVAGRLFGAEAEPVKIGRYTVLKRLGAGGMGIVYSAYDDALDRKVAVKLLRGAETDELRRARLVREAQALARLSHPNVIHVYEVGEFRGQVFVAMEFVRGATLDTVGLDSDGEHDLESVLDAFRQAGLGLAAAHAAGLIHRDFKPENALIDEERRVRVLDFGLARSADESEPVTTASSSRLDEDDSRIVSHSSSVSIDAPLTQTGAIMGTPAYMAPEQHLGRPTDARTDQFSFCVSLWEKLYGERPFRGKTLGELAVNVTNGRVDSPPSTRGVPSFVQRALLRGLAVDPQARFPTMDALLDALSFERRRRRRVFVGVGAMLLVGAAAAAWAGSRASADPCAGVEDKLVGVWDDPTRARVKAAFASSGVEYADAAWNATRAQIDDYTRDWVSMHRSACQASMVDQSETSETYGRRLVCLGQRLAEVEQLAGSLATADEKAVDRAVGAASSLGDLSRCADASALATISEGVDDETRGQLASLDREIARGQTRLELGKYADAVTIADEAAAEAGRLEDPAREAKALWLGGRARSELRDLDGAEERLRMSLRRADAARDDEARVRAGMWLIRVVGYQKREFEQADAIARDAEAALERLGRAPLLRAGLDQHIGSVARRRGDPESAAEHLQRSLSIRLDELGERNPMVPLTRTNLAIALASSSRYEEAEAALRAALVGFEELLGGGHPHMAYALSNLAALLIERGREAGAPGRHAAEAEAMLRRALVIGERVYGPEHSANAIRRQNLGEALKLQSKFAEARTEFELALALKKNSAPGSRAKTLTGLGESEWRVGDIDSARAHLDEALALLANTDEHDTRGEAGFVLARMLATIPVDRGGDPVRATTLATTALADYQRAGAAHAAEAAAVEAWLQR